MSILKKPYEIAVYEDLWVVDANGIGSFKEQRIAVIGSDKMDYLGRAFEPNLTTNVNGTKNFSFKLYRYFYDEFGEKVSNPFFDYLISERKIKLHYKNKWHDFIIKNINENSANYLYTYQLEDALVQELSKNGFGVTFDQALNNNTGTASYLATETLKETDWKVIEPEVFVQTVEEDLVYLQLRVKEDKTFACTRVFDQTTLTSGVTETNFTFDASFAETQNIDPISGEYIFEIFGFYSCCRNEPYRFQFIYLGNEKPNKKKENRVLQNKDCQYFIDLPNGGYSKKYCAEALRGHGFSLPQDLSGSWTINHVVSPVGDQTVSTLYRGARYGYAQKAEYLPQLERYVNAYKKIIGKDKEGKPIFEDWYGYQENEYVSPEFVINCITNPKFESTSGWIAGKESGTKLPSVENVLGQFVEEKSTKKFLSFAESLGSKTVEISGLTNYLKVVFDNSEQYLFNTGPTDNKSTIGYLGVGDVWAFQLKVVDEVENDVSNDCFEYDLAIYTRTSDGNWENANTFTCSQLIEGDYTLFTINTTPYSNKEEFKKYCKVKISIRCKNASGGTFYIKKASFFKVTRDDEEQIILPSEEVELNLEELEQSVVIKHCYYFPKSVVENISKDGFVPTVSLTSLDNNTYIPQFNDGAEKVRSISAKESNYFNILQTISETFGGWILLDAGRDDTGAITEKRVLLKNYLGKDNYAKIQYGINLKDITRTYESKNIVTKLIVKQNSNELAPNGFCNISRTKVNPTGENYIYDFQYYFNKELLDPDLFIEELYNEDGKAGTNIKGYFPRLRKINDQILKINEELEGYYSDLTKLKAEAETVKQGFLAADEELRLTEEDFWTLTGQNINSLLTNQAIYTFTNVSETNFPYKKYEIGELGKLESGKIYISELGTKVQVDNSNYNYCSSQGYLRVTLKRINGISGEIKGQIIITPLVNEGKNTLDTNFVIPADKDEADVAITLSPVDITRSDVRRLINDYQNYYTQKQDYDQRLLSLLGREEYRDFRQLPENLVIKEVSGRLASKETQYKDTVEARQELLDEKEALNKLFFTKYSRFIQEGTWISEEYVDDDKYYHDACSVLYNSCYPKVAYSINLMELSALPGYELFEMEVGDKTFVVDPEFFGDKGEVEIVVNQKSENLDSPEKSTISVQNFKNQFQDLFQKITATVQQAQYSQGSYEKAVALAEASDTRKMSFVSDALSDATAKLSAAGQQSVEWGNDGITITDVNTPTNSVRMIGGAILLSKQDEKTGELKWTTGMTADGISASLITAGRLNTNEIAIMNGDDILFRWDSFGISAFDYARYADGTVDVVSQVNPEKFVRFDKYGLYGMNQKGLSGLSWTPNDNKEIDQLATFALTWEGLKVTSGAGTILRIGDGAKVDPDDNYILNVKNKYGKVCFGIDGDGNLTWGDSSPDFDRDALLGILEEPVDGQQLQDGIYNDGNGHIAINASAIKTGVLLVGSLENEQPGDNTILYANIDQPEIYLAGWKVDKDSIYQEAIDNTIPYKKTGMSAKGERILFGNELKATFWSGSNLEHKTKEHSFNKVFFNGYKTITKAEHSNSLLCTSSNLYDTETLNYSVIAYDNSPGNNYAQGYYVEFSEKDSSKIKIDDTGKDYKVSYANIEPISYSLQELIAPEEGSKNLDYSYAYNAAYRNFEYPQSSGEIAYYWGNVGEIDWPGQVNVVFDPQEGAYVSIDCDERIRDDSGKIIDDDHTLCVFEQSFVENANSSMKFRLRVRNRYDDSRYEYNNRKEFSVRLCDSWGVTKANSILHLVLGFDNNTLSLFRSNAENGNVPEKETYQQICELCYLENGELSPIIEFYIIPGTQQSGDLRTFDIQVHTIENGSATWKGDLYAEIETYKTVNVLRIVPYMACTSELQVSQVVDSWSTDDYSDEKLKIVSTAQFDATLEEKYIESFANFYVTAEGEMHCEDAYIKGIIEAEKGHIGGENGWMIDSGSITTGNLGENNSFHMYSSNYPTAQKFGSSEGKQWALGVGTNFGVTVNGETYLAQGYVGKLKITEEGLGELSSDGSFYPTFTGMSLTNNGIQTGKIQVNRLYIGNYEKIQGTNSKDITLKIAGRASSDKFNEENQIAHWVSSPYDVGGARGHNILAITAEHLVRGIVGDSNTGSILYAHHWDTIFELLTWWYANETELKTNYNKSILDIWPK